ncbi:cell wall hydrolase [Alkaliphilus transvaalensis]|uniref:cell wall hydrolase n=1 Tax=Alkaliphilus transvaalensis TaxID=114628 RepID=UPI00047AD1E9|nr:cell wall hydrolase [Alkaliphilus transvaalensis]
MQKHTKKMIAICLVLLFVSIQVVSVSAVPFTRTLMFGSRGSDVSRLQQELKNRGYFNHSVTGYYGQITERAVINFQIASRIRIDGIAGPQTHSALFGNSATATTVSRGASPARNYSNDDVYWLSRIIHAEAQGEPYQGMVAVGNVVLNRVNSREFPNSIYSVIFEYYGSIPQFSPVADGSIYNTPSQRSIDAARESLNGARPVGNATYFFNPDKAAGTWIVRNKSYVTRIGAHVFYQ